MPIAQLAHTSDPVPNVTLKPVEGTTWGDRLPQGIFDAEVGHIRDFEFNPPIMRIRKKMGALKSRKGLTKHPGRYVAYFLAEALASLGPWDMNKLKVDEAALRVARMSLGDVIYLLMRWHELGHPEGLPLPAFSCGACGTSFAKVSADLSSLGLVVLPDNDCDGNPFTYENQPRVRLGLRKGIPSPKGHASTVLLKPPTWMDSFWSLDANNWRNDELRSCLVMKGAICGTDSDDLAVVPLSAIDEVWPDDQQRIDSALALVVATPDLGVELPCPECAYTNRLHIDWSSPDFLG